MFLGCPRPFNVWRCICWLSLCKSILCLVVLTEAVEQIGSVAAHINEHIKQQDNFTRMLHIQKSLSGAAAPRLLIPGRVFIKEGALRKVLFSLCIHGG